MGEATIHPLSCWGTEVARSGSLGVGLLGVSLLPQINARELGSWNDCGEKEGQGGGLQGILGKNQAVL